MKHFPSKFKKLRVRDKNIWPGAVSDVLELSRVKSFMKLFAASIKSIDYEPEDELYLSKIDDTLRVISNYCRKSLIELKVTSQILDFSCTPFDELKKLYVRNTKVSNFKLVPQLTSLELNMSKFESEGVYEVLEIAKFECSSVSQVVEIIKDQPPLKELKMEYGVCDDNLFEPIVKFVPDIENIKIVYEDSDEEFLAGMQKIGELKNLRRLHIEPNVNIFRIPMVHHAEAKGLIHLLAKNNSQIEELSLQIYIDKPNELTKLKYLKKLAIGVTELEVFMDILKNLPNIEEITLNEQTSSTYSLNTFQQILEYGPNLKALTIEMYDLTDCNYDSVLSLVKDRVRTRFIFYNIKYHYYCSKSSWLKFDIDPEIL